MKQINQTITHLIQEHENDVIHRILLDEIKEQGESIGPNVRKHLLQQVAARNMCTVLNNTSTNTFDMHTNSSVFQTQVSFLS